MLDRIYNLSSKQVNENLLTPEEFKKLDVNRKMDELYKSVYINIKLALSIRRNQKKPRKVNVPEGKTYETGVKKL